MNQKIVKLDIMENQKLKSENDVPKTTDHPIASEKKATTDKMRKDNNPRGKTIDEATDPSKLSQL